MGRPLMAAGIGLGGLAARRLFSFSHRSLALGVAVVAGTTLGGREDVPLVSEVAVGEERAPEGPAAAILSEAAVDESSQLSTKAVSCPTCSFCDLKKR